MKPEDLPTVEYMNDCFSSVLSHVQQVLQALPSSAASGVPRLLRIEDVMEECKVTRDTVQRWMKKGKPGRNGQIIRLQHYLFSPTQPHIPWPALAAFGQGLDFDLACLNMGPTAPMEIPPLRKAG